MRRLRAGAPAVPQLAHSVAPGARALRWLRWAHARPRPRGAAFSPLETFFSYSSDAYIEMKKAVVETGMTSGCTGPPPLPEDSAPSASLDHP